MTLNPKKTKKLRQHLRNNMTKTEIMLWNRLKGKQLKGFKIRRQYGVGSYIIDFYCPKLKLGIEIDGESHYKKDGIEHDRIRDQFLKEQGIDLLRIPTTEIKHNLEGVIEYLAGEFNKRNPQW